MSDYSVKILDLETQQVSLNLPDFHRARIQNLIYQDHLLITCSNDRSIKLYDLTAGKLIKQFKGDGEYYSIAKSKHILAGGQDSKIEFYDLNVMKWRSRFTS